MSADTMSVKPAEPGLVVRFPGNPGTRLPEAGAEVPRSTYWMRRLADGDVVPVEAPQPHVKHASKAK